MDEFSLNKRHLCEKASRTIGIATHADSPRIRYIQIVWSPNNPTAIQCSTWPNNMLFPLYLLWLGYWRYYTPHWSLSSRTQGSSQPLLLSLSQSICLAYQRAKHLNIPSLWQGNLEWDSTLTLCQNRTVRSFTEVCGSFLSLCVLHPWSWTGIILDFTDLTSVSFKILSTLECGIKRPRIDNTLLIQNISRQGKSSPKKLSRSRLLEIPRAPVRFLSCVCWRHLSISSLKYQLKSVTGYWV